MSLNPLQTFANLSVRWKLLIGFGFLLILLALMALIAVNETQKLVDSADRMTGVALTTEKFLTARIDEKNFFLREEAQEGKKALDRIDESIKRVQRLAEDAASPEQRETLRSLEGSLGEYKGFLENSVLRVEEALQLQATMEENARSALSLLEQIQGQVAASNALNGQDGNTQNGAAAMRHFLQARIAEKNFIARNSADYIAAFEGELEALSPILEQLNDGASRSDTRAEIAELQQNLGDYQDLFTRMVSAYQEVATLTALMVDEARETEGLVQDAFQLQRDMMAAVEAETEWFLGIAVSFGIVVGLTITFVITGLITRPLEIIVEQAEKVANGDLTGNIESTRKDELGRLISVIQKMTVNLRSLIKDLHDGVTQLASSSEELSAVTEQTSAGARQQRDETDQAATAMNEMTATVHEVSQNASSAAQSAELADEHAKEGFNLVKQSAKQVDTLSDDIEDSKARIQKLNGDVNDIGKILDVIDGIAEQTNLLALNAAIEAARAGEHGKGFAVVADEVRGLAQRTQSSVEQIEGLIKKLQESSSEAAQSMDRNSDSADAAVAVVKNAGEALKTIAEAVSNIQSMNHQIAAAVEEQSSVAESINEGVVTIREVTEQSATATEQIAISSNELAKLGGELHKTVSRFSI